MNARTIFLTVAGLALLACSGGTPTAPVATPPAAPAPVAAPPPAAPAPAAAPASALPYPWSALNLPVGAGEVITSDNDKLLIGYESDSLLSLTNAYVGTLTAQGYVQKEDVSFPGVTALVFGKGTQMFGLATGNEEGLNFVYMEDLSNGKSSNIRSRKMPGTGGARRRPGGPRHP